MKINTEIQDITKDRPQLEVLTSIKETGFHDNLDQENTLYGENALPLDEKKAKLLQIEEIEPKLIVEIANKNTTQTIRLNITCTGIENSLRNEKDGITYFGCFNDDENVSF